MAAILRIVIKKERINNGIESLEMNNHFSASKQPSLLLHLWSVLPILLIAEGDIGLASIAILAALISFFLIQAKTSTTMRYISSGFIGVIPFLLYFFLH